MAYHVYTTKGIVLGSYPSREADRVYSIFTEELGLVRARARSVRAIQSKLRGSLEPFSLSSISLVRGKDSWRITGAALEKKINEEYAGKRGILSFARIFSLLEKLVVGEESHKEILALLEHGLAYVYQIRDSADMVDMLEILLVLRLLNELGYVSGNEVDAIFLKDEYSEKLLSHTKENKKMLIDAINRGLHSSNLV